ncbi:MAG: thioredoxin domain-containing protein [Gemmatimonadota bacterium]|nr:MAG: thioredoxin domain-containing protein [Gemmatimonadota bacterium]
MRKALALLLGMTFLTAAAAMAQESGARSDIPLLERADAARTVGSETAVIVIDQFIDFACPDCTAFHMQKADSLLAMVEEEDLRLSIRFYPIPRLLRGFQAAEAALCAAALVGRPGFLGMLQQLFEHQADWRYALDPTPVFDSYAEGIGVPLDRYRECAARDAMAPLIISDIRMAKDAGIPGTPTFVFNKRGELTGDVQFYDVQPMARFREAIEQIRGR